MASQTKGLRRNTIDKYYTNPETVKLCIEYIDKYVVMDDFDLIIEPSAGNGAFIEGIKSLTYNHLFYDIEPENDEIIKQDFLKLDIYAKGLNEFQNKIHIVGNPPFGRQSSLAIKFIKKACEFAHSISFILPKSFKKDSLIQKFPLNFHRIFEIDLPDNSFLVNGETHDVPCIFQIWMKRSYNRETVEQMKPLNFRFVKKTENPDISFRRVGVNAGTIDTECDTKSIQSHYFIKFSNDKNVADNIIRLSGITFDFNNTIGPKSISKQELIQKFNPLLKNYSN
jgi:predicted RNA methylase